MDKHRLKCKSDVFRKKESKVILFLKNRRDRVGFIYFFFLFRQYTDVCDVYVL